MASRLASPLVLALCLGAVVLPARAQQAEHGRQPRAGWYTADPLRVTDPATAWADRADRAALRAAAALLDPAEPLPLLLRRALQASPMPPATPYRTAAFRLAGSGPGPAAADGRRPRAPAPPRASPEPTAPSRGAGLLAVGAVPDSVAAAEAAARRAAAAAADSVVAARAAAVGGAAGSEPAASPFGIPELAELGVRVRGSGDFGGSWARRRPCEPGRAIDCNPGALPQVRPDLRFGVQVGGVISDRVHVNLDYDQSREFDAANSVNVYYQGMPGEVVQRVELGDVSLRLPSSRYMTRGVPAGNFGLMASARLGPVDVQTVLAQQTGAVASREFRINLGGDDSGTAVDQDATLVLDDADYAKSQFFLLADPARLAGYPHVDVLSLRAAAAPPDVRPSARGTIELYRDEGLAGRPLHGQPGRFLADAVAPATQGPSGSAEARHTGTFRRLVQGQDYVLHGSGLWLMLRAPLRPDEALAVAYVTESGDTVGSLRAESAPAGTTPRLRLLRGASAAHQPGSATWPLELRQVYRVDGAADIEPANIQLRISLGELSAGRTFRDVSGQRVPFLRFFGLDRDAPADRVDAARVFRPALETGGAGFGAGVGTPAGTWLVLPTLRPFAEPAPLQDISAEALADALGRDANAAIYDDADVVVRDGAGRFRLTIDYRVSQAGGSSSFSLGAFGVRPGSERLLLGSRQLERDVDYTIDYDVGVVTLLNASQLALAPDAGIRATWEQVALFDVAPTRLVGASARYDLGGRGELNVVGLYQAERALQNRPQLGVEPGAALVGGAGGRLELGGALLDRALGALGVRTSLPSYVRLGGEVALTLPNPNRQGAAYLDDFEAAEELPLRPHRHDWRLGSAPQSTAAAGSVLPASVDAASAVPLVWQHDIRQDGANGGLVQPHEIDRQISFMGTALPEPVMWLTFGNPPGATSPLPAPADPRRWRSITTALSATGLDLSRAEYIELYVSARSDQPLSLVLDVGTVGEDGFYVDSLGRTSGVRDDGTRWGLGVLDDEASAADREVWGADRDARGLWDQACVAEPLAAYPLGDARSNCTRGNGVQDTEDLNGNGVLDADDGAYFRYVVDLHRASEYLVRDTAATGTAYRLYRIPLRSGAAVNGATEGTWRFIRHLRLTVAGTGDGARVLSLARMRIVGSRWTKRGGDGIRSGLLSDEPGAGVAELRVGPVSRRTDGASYSPPPGVVEELQDASAQFSAFGQELETKGMKLEYDALQPGERAEVFFRYPQQPRSLLAYRELRLWVLPRAGSWGGGGERLTVRIGTDDRNYYLYQTPLRPATGPGPVQAADWLPELVIPFEPWLALKLEAERLLLERGPSAAGSDTLWSADSAYALVLEDRARAPNLAAVRELAFAVYNGGTLASTGAVWLDELRVGRADTDAGAAGTLVLDIGAGGVVNASLSVSNRGALFRQPGESPLYMGGADAAVTVDAQLDRLLPERWGIALPLSVAHVTQSQAPHFLEQSDVGAAGIEGLRRAGSDATRISLRLSRRAPHANPLLGVLLDGAALRVGYTTGSNAGVLSRSASRGFTGDLSYYREPVTRQLGIVPRPAAAALRALAPAVVERSDVFQRLLSSRLRWSPASLSFGTGYTDQLTRSFHYDRIIALPSDTAVAALLSPRQGLRSEALLALRPFDALTASVMVSSDRDVLPAARATDRPLEQAALDAARARVGGLDLGWETYRVMGTNVSYRPRITSWLAAGWTHGSRFVTDRSPLYLDVDVTGSDSSATLQRRFEGSRHRSRTLTLQPAGMLTAAGVDSTVTMARLAARIENVDVAWRTGLSSLHDRRDHAPGPLYQLGMGGMTAFRVVNGDTATRTHSRDDVSVATRVLLRRALRLELAYGRAGTAMYDARGGARMTRETAWPRASLQWLELPVPARLQPYVARASASAGVQRTERAHWFGDAMGATDVPHGDAGAATGMRDLRSATELGVPFSLSVGLHGGVTASYRGALSFGETLDPTGDARSGGYQHDITLSGSLRPPHRWRGSLQHAILVSVQYADQRQRQCRYGGHVGVPVGAGDTLDCVAFLELDTRSANARLETRLADVDVGVLLNYVARRSHVGLRDGTSQFQVGLYGRFNFEAGSMNALMPRRQF